MVESEPGRLARAGYDNQMQQLSSRLQYMSQYMSRYGTWTSLPPSRRSLASNPSIATTTPLKRGAFQTSDQLLQKPHSSC